MRPPILQLGLDLLFLGLDLLFLVEKLLIAFLGIPGRSISRFHSFGFYLLPATFTLWAFSPFFPQGKVQPLDSLANPMSGLVYGMDEREKR
jgi:hypothetical protein